MLWYVLQATHSTFLVGVTLAAELLPAAIIAPIAGVYVDRINRKIIMLASNLFQGAITFTLALLYVTSTLNFPFLILLVFLLMAGGQFFRPAVQATIPRMATRSDLLAANSLFTVSESLNQLVGYGLGGIIVGLFGITIPILYDGFTFLFAVALLTFIAGAYGAIQTSSDAQITSSFWARFQEGLHFIRTKRILIQLAVVAVIVNFFGAATQALIAPYVQDTLHSGATTFGFFLAAFSLGVIIGSIGVGKINARKYVGYMGFLGIVIIGVAFGLLGILSIIALALLLAFIGGVGSAIVNLPIQALIQVSVPGELMGRVFTSLGALGTLSQPVATIIAGGIAGYTTVNGGFELFGVLIVATTIVAGLFFKELRTARY